MSRKNFKKSILVTRFKHAGGRCEWIDAQTGVRCDAVLVPGRWHGDHDTPDQLGGQPTFENCRCLCIPHHKLKTGKQDKPAIAQAQRREAKHLGAVKPKATIKAPPKPARSTAKADQIRALREAEYARRFG